ncbi:MAG: NUDIX domain-containing protein [Oscillospiraceae bacterium]|jgi:8-oxo-dGTP pyrophosphatase MutT (NUDIX family)|nr:NUDIX domain-containing protein [Oscillospiraceae bacterium]
MDRAQCLIVRDHKILCVKHREPARTYFCLPGGGIEPGETPEAAAVRELREECLVDGANLTLISTVTHDGHTNYTFTADIGAQQPALGADPELPENPILAGVEWRALDSLCERDRAYMWTAGLICYQEFSDELESWGDDISYPEKRRAPQP